MFEQDYNALYESEKEEFRRVANYILSKTFVVRDVYDKQAKKMITSSEFLFMERYYDIFENYLSIAGWKLTKEPIEGIYWVENIYGQNKAKFDSFTTYILLALMITYEESAPITTLGNSVITTTYETKEDALAKLDEVTRIAATVPQGREQAVYYRDEVTSAMEALRAPVDKLEMLVDKSMWPMPSYGDLIFEV